jgi:hypothetical protein
VRRRPTEATAVERDQRGAFPQVHPGREPAVGHLLSPEPLPEPAGAIGRLLPRSTAFFDGAGATGPLTVLAAWILVGLAADRLAA